MKTLAELQAECHALRITVQPNGRSSKEPYIAVLRDFHWERDHSGQPLPPQLQPMLLAAWEDLDDETAQNLETDHHAWIVQEKKDGVRALFHVDDFGARLTSRSMSEVNYRLSEFQDNLPHLGQGLDAITGTILDGELVCPQSEVNTGNTISTSALQATVAILATSPENAALIQKEDQTKLRFHVFDILKCSGQHVTALPLSERLEKLVQILGQINNPFIEMVPSFSVNKQAIHDRIIERGGEGTVWKNASEPYEPGRRVKHWIKRKRGIQVEAFVTGFKLGKSGRGHEHLVGAVEFSIHDPKGHAKPIAWISSWTDEERHRLTTTDQDGFYTLHPSCYERRAVIMAHDQSGRSKRLRHARLKQWLE